MAKLRPARSKIITIENILRSIEERAPLQCSEEWDNVGLLVGSSKSKITSVVISIDLTDDAIDLAIRKKANLIINHHPCIFPKSKGLSRVSDNGSPGSQLVHKAIKNGISVAAYHTNFDQCALEVVQAVASGLGIEPRGRLLDKPRAHQTHLVKLVVFIPRDHVDAVRNAICEAGAGHIGAYDFCTFGTEGVGTFRGGKKSRPFLGKAGRLEQVREVRLETIFPRGLERAVLAALRKAHPYEEIAYDLYDVQQMPGQGAKMAGITAGIARGLGYGFWGEFKSNRPFSDVAKGVKQLFKLDGFLLTNPPPNRVRKIAFVAGKGASFIDAAISAGCDLFITGEAGYHVALDGARKGVAVMELGHRESERFFLTTMEGWLAQLGVRATLVKEVTQKIWK